MQSVTAPRDGEWLMARDLAEATGIACVAQYPEEVTGEPLAHVRQVGCAPVTAVTWEHDWSIDVWAGAGDDYAEATQAAYRIAGAISAMARRTPASGNAWHDPSVTSVYPNPDPNHPGVPRVTVAANAALRGAEQ